MSQFFTSGGQSIGASASALVVPVYIQGWKIANQASESENEVAQLCLTLQPHRQ